MKRYHRFSAAITRSTRWKAVRLLALRRDRFRCVQCGARGRLEVDHVQPVRTHPEAAFDLSNCQSLCPACHTRKTRLECGHAPLSPARQAWRNAVAELATKPEGTNNA